MLKNVRKLSCRKHVARRGQSRLNRKHTHTLRCTALRVGIGHNQHLAIRQTRNDLTHAKRCRFLSEGFTDHNDTSIMIAPFHKNRRSFVFSFYGGKHVPRHCYTHTLKAQSTELPLERLQVEDGLLLRVVGEMQGFVFLDQKQTVLCPRLALLPHAEGCG